MGSAELAGIPEQRLSVAILPLRLRLDQNVLLFLSGFLAAACRADDGFVLVERPSQSDAGAQTCWDGALSCLLGWRHAASDPVRRGTATSA